MKPILSSHQDVKRIVQESCRAKLISQIVGSPDNFPAYEFASYFKGPTREAEPPCLLTSHGKKNIQPRKQLNIPIYRSLIQNLRWSPYVEVSSANNSKTNIEENDENCTCNCNTCNENLCPSKAAISNTMRQSIFRDNIMTFSDRYTMTPKFNDVSCGGNIPGMPTPQSSNTCVAVRDTEAQAFFAKNLPQNPIPILKRTQSKLHDNSHQHQYCGHAIGCESGIRQEAVRDTDMTAEEDYCKSNKPKSYKAFFKFKKKASFEIDKIANNSGRKIIYNEGISDELADNIPSPARMACPVDVEREPSKNSIRKECSINRIPYSHNSESRYHYHCKKSDMKPHHYTSELDDVRHLVESTRIVRKTVPAKLPARHYKPQKISLPRKVLTSELDIDSYVERSRPSPLPPKCRRTKSKKLF